MIDVGTVLLHNLWVSAGPAVRAALCGRDGEARRPVHAEPARKRAWTRPSCPPPATPPQRRPSPSPSAGSPEPGP